MKHLECYQCGLVITPQPEGAEHWFRAVLPAGQPYKDCMCGCDHIYAFCGSCLGKQQCYIKIDGHLLEVHGSFLGTFTAEKSEAL